MQAIAGNQLCNPESIPSMRDARDFYENPKAWNPTEMIVLQMNVDDRIPKTIE